MITLATYDIVYNFIRPELVEVYKKGYHFYAGHKIVPVIQVYLRRPVYCTIAISIERYLALKNPINYNQVNLGICKTLIV